LQPSPRFKRKWRIRTFECVPFTCAAGQHLSPYNAK
jgi:hypothetical protein